MISSPAFADAGARAVRLAERTSFRIGGRPEYLFEPATEAEAGEVVRACRRAGVPWRVLGGGCNLLVSDDGVPGAVIATRRLREERVYDDRVEAGAGVPFQSLVARAAALGVPILSGCPGIPGSVGGVVTMNAGGRFGTVSDALLAVRGFDAEGVPFSRPVRDGDFGYRRSAFDGCLLVGATFRRLARLDAAAERGRFAEALAQKRATQPLAAASAGCVFKNPGPVASAGRLIDASGLKGERVGDAAVSPLHANFIVNLGGARCADVLALIGRVRSRVATAHDTVLEVEVRTWV